MTKKMKVVALFLVLTVAQAVAIISGHAYDDSSNKAQKNQLQNESEKDKNGSVKPTPAPDGAALYSQHCVQCHGQSKRGKTAAEIQNAIKNVRYMSSLVLTTEQINAIASADWPANLKKGSAGVQTKSPKNKYN